MAYSTEPTSTMTFATPAPTPQIIDEVPWHGPIVDPVPVPKPKEFKALKLKKAKKHHAKKAKATIK